MLNTDDGVVKASRQDKVVEHLLRNDSGRDWVILEGSCCTAAFCTILRRCFTTFKGYFYALNCSFFMGSWFT